MCSLLLLPQYLVLYSLQSRGQRRARLLQLLMHQRIYAKVRRRRGRCRDSASRHPAIYRHTPNGGPWWLDRWRGRTGSGGSLGCLWCGGGLRGVRALRRRALGVWWAGDVGRGEGRWRAGLSGHHRVLLDRVVEGGAGHGVDELGWFGRRGRGHRFGRDRRRDLLSFHYRKRKKSTAGSLTGFCIVIINALISCS